MPKKSAEDKIENSADQKSVNLAIDAHAKNFLTEAEMKKFRAWDSAGWNAAVSVIQEPGL